MAGANAALNRVYKGVDRKEDMILMLSPDANWERFLTPAPYTISLLGELMLISGDRDFSIKENAPRKGFKFLRHPSSFKACLVQVSNDGWSAFNKAHTNMDQIRLHSANVETHVKSAIKILLGGTKEDVADILPVCLGRVTSIADNCKKLAIDTEENFFQVMNVIQELMEVCTASKGSYEKKYRETVVALNVVQQQKEQVQNNRDEIEKESTRLREEVKQAQTDFTVAMNNIPSGGKILAYSAIEGAINGVKWMLNIIPFLQRSRSVTHVHQYPHNNLESQTNATKRETSMEGKIPEEVRSLRNWLDDLSRIATSERRRNKPYPRLQAVKDDKVAFLRHNFDRLFSQMQQSSTDTSTEKTIMELCKEASDICKRLESLAEKAFEIDSNGKEGSTIANDAKTLSKKATQSLTIPDPAGEQSPTMRQMAAPMQSGGIVKTMNDNARYKVEKAQKILNDARKRHEKAYEEMRKENERLQQLIKEMASLDPQKIDFEVIKSTLTRGMTALANVREQWAKLVEFFEVLSNKIKCSLSSSLEQFVETSDKKQKSAANNDYSVSKTFRRKVIDEAVEANSIAFCVHSIAATYVYVSQEHIMTPLSGISKFVAIDHDDPLAASTIQHLRDELHSGTEKAQEEMKGLIETQFSDFRSRLDSRERRFRKDVESIFPGVSEFEIQEIGETVTAGMIISDDELNGEIDDLL